jgi:hypothetical protein
MARKDPTDEWESASELIVLLLQERLRRLEEGCYSNANDRHLRRLCSALLWQHSEAFGKYRGCQYWSHGAIDSFKRHDGVVTSKLLYGNDALIHEHLFPRGQLIEKLFALSEPTGFAVSELLTKLNTGVVITAGEDKTLSKEGTESDPWERYRNANIQYRTMCDAEFP